MAFMKRDVNIGLLLLIIASILLFSGFSVYYQTRFKDVSLEYREKLGQLSDVTNQLSSKRQELNETYSMRVKAEQDKQTLDVQYNEVRNENEALSSELITTKSDLAEKKAELSATKSLLSQTQTRLTASLGEVTSLKSRVSSLNDDIDRICVKLTAAGGSDSEC